MTSSDTPARADVIAVPRVPVIDTFRGLAILLVILYHITGNIVFPSGWGITRGADGAAHLPTGSLVLRFVFLPFHLGRIGVNLFFVISGLCIHLRLAEARARNPDAPFSPGVFFLRRFWRIYPVYWAALAVGIFVGPFIYSSITTGHLDYLAWPTWQSIVTHVFMLHDFSKYWMNDILHAMWSIATEEQFYLLYPLVFVYVGRRVSEPWLVLLLLTITLAWRAAFVLGNPPPTNFFEGPFLVWLWGFSIARYYEWSLGALLAWAIANHRSLAILPVAPARYLGARPRLVVALGIGLILLGAASLLRVRVKWMIEDPCYSTGWFLIMAATLLPAEGPARTRRPSAWAFFDGGRARFAMALRALGRRSFSVYLLHELPLMAAVVVMRRYAWSMWPTVALAFVLIAAVCLPFYRFVEVPFERRSKAIGARKIAAPPATAPVVAA